MVSNNSSCDVDTSTVLSVPVLRIICATNTVSATVCLLASTMVCALKLQHKAVYRLALYQVLASLAFSIVLVSQIAFIHYQADNEAYNYACIAIAFLTLFTQWAKLVLTMWLTAHLLAHIFCFSMLEKNLKKLEATYIVTSLFVPAVFAGVALGIRSYGLGEFGCWISLKCRKENSSFGTMFFERLALWDGPAASILLISSVAMVIMMIKLAFHIHQRRRYVQMKSDDKFWKALKQLLPLAAFPVLFYAFIIPQFAFHVYQFEFEVTNYQLPNNDPFYVVTSASFSVWSFVSGLTLIVHICVARLSQHCKDKGATHQDSRGQRYGATIDDEGSVTVKWEMPLRSTSETNFPLPTDN